MGKIYTTKKKYLEAYNYQQVEYFTEKDGVIPEHNISNERLMHDRYNVFLKGSGLEPSSNIRYIFGESIYNIDYFLAYNEKFFTCDGNINNLIIFNNIPFDNSNFSLEFTHNHFYFTQNNKTYKEYFSINTFPKNNSNSRTVQERHIVPVDAVNANEVDYITIYTRSVYNNYVNYNMSNNIPLLRKRVYSTQLLNSTRKTTSPVSGPNGLIFYNNYINYYYNYSITSYSTFGENTNLRIYSYNNINMYPIITKTNNDTLFVNSKNLNHLINFYDENISYFNFGPNISSQNQIYFNKAKQISKVYALVKKIPDEYQEVEYIQNDGNHYIDSEYQPNENTRIYGEFGNISSSTVIAENFFGVNETDKHYWTNFDNQELKPYLQSQIYNEDKVQKEIDFQDFLRPRKIIIEKELDKLKYTLTKTNDLSTETKFSLLPSEYKEVEYIRSTGTQYIDLNFIPDQNTGFDLEFMTRNSMATVGHASILGAEYAKNSRCIKLSTWSDTGCTGQFVFNATQNFNIALEPWKKNIIKFRNRVLTKPDGTTLTVSGTFNSDFNLYLFAVNSIGIVDENSKLFLYHAKFYDGDTLIRDLYPCIRKFDNKPGLYDIVNKVFYTNAAIEGEDFFTSEDLLLPQEYQQVEYIQSTGTQHIVTPATLENIAQTIIEFEMSADTNQYTVDLGYMGAYNPSSTSSSLVMWMKGADNKGITRARIGNKTSDRITAANFNTDIHHYLLNAPKNRVAVDTTFANLSSVTKTNSIIAIDIFGVKSTTDDFTIKGKFYHGKVVINTEVYDYYPCYRKSDGVAGVYDIIHDQFLTNAAETGDDFIIGPKVNADGSLIVPNNYLKLDYLESDGNQYIDTLVSNTTGLRIEGDIELLNSGERQGIIGSDIDTTGISILINSERSLLAKLGAGTATISTNYLYKNSRFNFNLDEKNIRVSINNITTAKTSSAAYSQIIDEIPNIKLFGDSYRPNGECRIYSVKITEDDIITHYYVPCINIQTNIAGMYDVITNTFLTNSGTGEFITKYNNYYYELETNPYLFENYNNLYISAINDINEERVWSSNLKIYRFKIYEKDKIIKDFIPVERKSGNLLGLFDICNQSFHPFETNEEILDNTQSGNNIENNDNTAHIITKVYTSVNNIAKQVHQRTYIPKEYQQVEYVGCSANAVVDLGFIPTLYTGFDIDFNQSKTITNSGWGTIFGTRKGAKINSYCFLSYNGGTIELNNLRLEKLGMLRNTKQNFSFRNLSIRNYNANGFTKLNLGNYFLSPPGNLTLFSLKNNTATSQVSNGFANIFSLKFYNGYKKQNDYYPCYRINDGAIGFYDRISKQFITQTAGTLIKGNNFVKRL